MDYHRDRDRDRGGYDGEHGGYERRGRPNRRNATDIGTTYVRWMQNRRAAGKASRGFETERPSASYVADILPPAAHRDRPADTIPAKHLHSSLNKVRQPVNVVKWTPEGRRLLTGSTSGEFTLWNGTGFNFETIMQAHDVAIRSIRYSHSNEWLLSADQDGVVKYWQTNFNNVQSIRAHDDAPVRDVAFAPTDTKFVTAADDTTMKVWDFASGTHESTLSGHQWDVKCADWHPTKGLIASGSKDHTVRLWDPRTSRCLTTLHGHKNTLTMVRFEPSNGVLLASCAREQNGRVFDIRMMRDVFMLKGHEKEISCLTWHPIHSSLLTTAGNDGSMFHYLLDEQNPPPGIAATLSPYDSPNPSDASAQMLYPAHRVTHAHDYAIWSMDWHPLGHILASGSNDRATRFWTRPRPGDDSYTNDRWHIGQEAAEARGTWKKAEAHRQQQEEEMEDEDEGLVDQKMPARILGLPGLAGLPGLVKLAPASHPIGINPERAQLLDVSGFANGMPPAPPGLPDLETLKKVFGGSLPPPPLVNGALPQMPNFANGVPPMPPGFAPPPGFPLPGIAALSPTPTNGGGIRKRAPLPSQEESLQAEMRQGKFRTAR
ncbi:pre-mRNA cleavage and polyadenylation factor (CPF) complex subunit [Elasticomyces elasticus]|uniref:Polyadenylation factor subunit 2 n=1 Tax=Elasticomyces elasticus TaxID=574655 RepID=A0AAN7VQK0_9PEZI|nr:pre-mRNA cleavage and polyadenylation factor (CPF) complex subunit [Elasticomyces elasticus]